MPVQLIFGHTAFAPCADGPENPVGFLSSRPITLDRGLPVFPAAGQGRLLKERLPPKGEEVAGAHRRRGERKRDRIAPSAGVVNTGIDPKLLARQPDEVARMFTEISPRYDLLNRVLSFGLDGSWRKTAVRFARPAQARHILDLASGTGDLSLAFAEAPGFSGDVLGIDFSEAMVQRAREKAIARRLGARVQFREGDALATGEPDEAYDVVSIGFGLRNFIDPEQGLHECLRVLTPGGRLVVVDFFSKDEIPPVRFYLDHLLPLVGRIVSRSRSAYTYLRESKKGFWTPEELTHRLLAAGFREVMTKPLTMGIAHCVVGVKRSGFS